MKLSLKLEYACRVLCQMARKHGRQEIVRIEELAEREAISPNYLVQILNDLRTSGLVASKRGKLGGYTLAKTPSEISLLDIVNAIEGRLLESSTPGNGESGMAVTHSWRRIADEFERRLADTNLAEMASYNAEGMYYI